MIDGSILSRRDCAGCRECCLFDSYDLWDTPVVTDEVMAEALKVKPDQRFTEASGRRLFVMDREPDGDVYYCPMLDRERGCRLGDGKPFDCRIFPFRLMRLGERRVIALSPVCPVGGSRSFAELLAEARRLAPAIFAEGDSHPELVRPYAEGYPVMIFE